MGIERSRTELEPTFWIASLLVYLFFHHSLLSVVLVIIVLYFVCSCDAVKLWWMITRTVPTILLTAAILQTPANIQSMWKFVLFIYFYSLNNLFAITQQFNASFCGKCWTFSFIFIAWSFFDKKLLRQVFANCAKSCWFMVVRLGLWEWSMK